MKTMPSGPARGRAAQLVAQTRASLKEPTRPVTPASYDDRTRIQRIPTKPSQCQKRQTSPSDVSQIDNRSDGDSESEEREDDFYPVVTTSKASDDWRLCLMDLDDAMSKLEEFKTRIQHLPNGVENCSDEIVPSLRDVSTLVDSLLKHETKLSEAEHNQSQPLLNRCSELLQIFLNEQSICTSAQFIICGTLIKLCNKQMDSSFRQDTLPEPVCAMLADTCEHTFHLSKGVSVQTTFIGHIMQLLRSACTIISAVADGMVVGIYRFSLMPGWPKYVEAIMLATGVLRNLTDSENNRKILAHSQAVTILNELLLTAIRYKLCGETSQTVQLTISAAEREHLDTAEVILADGIVQAVSILRNLWTEKTAHKEMLSVDSVTTLCSALGAWDTHDELVYSVTRILAKQSLSEQFRSQINSRKSNLSNLLQLMKVEGLHCHESNSIAWPKWHTFPLLSRLGFTLSNLTTSNTGNRQTLATDTELLVALTTLLQYCVNRIADKSDTVPKQPLSLDNSNDSLTSVNEDDIAETAIRIVRLLANLAMEESAGSSLSADSTLCVLTDLLQISEACPRFEQLLLNTSAAVTNLTYYSTPDEDTLSELCECLIRCLLSTNDEVILEAARALGNVTRSAIARESVYSFRGHEVLLLLLQHSDAQLVRASLGVLVNLSGDVIFKDVFGLEETITELIHLLRASSLRDLHLSTLTCHVLHNFLLIATDRESALGAHRPQLTSTLQELVSVAQEVQDSCSQDPSRNQHFLTAAAALTKIMEM